MTKDDAKSIAEALGDLTPNATAPRRSNERIRAARIANRLLDEPLADPDCDACVLARQFERSQEEIKRLRAALVGAIEVIRTWHNMGIKNPSELWNIYWRNAPEMKPIREALSNAVEPSERT